MQDKTVVEQLSSYRKSLADEFYANEEKDGKKIWTCKYERKLAIFPHLSALHNYFGMKSVNKPFPPGKGKKVVSLQERKDNLANYLQHMQDLFPDGYRNLEVTEKIRLSAIVWGSP